MMNSVTLTIDDIQVTVSPETTILKAAQQAGIYIPHICSHPALPPVVTLKPAATIYQGKRHPENKKPGLEYDGCQLCVVKIDGKADWHRACNTPVAAGTIIHTSTPELQEFRQKQLMSILAKHPHACLTCAQKEGCARFPCSMNVPENERCCRLFGNCELQRIAEYIGIKEETPRYVFEDLPIIKDDPLFERNYNLCIGCTRCVRVCREELGVAALDFVFDKEERVTVGTVAPTLGESGCRFCTACVEVCPTGALLDKEEYKGAPCQNACPAGVDVPRYVRAIGEGKFGEAAAIIREKIPFPAVCGYTCVHFCEAKCRRGQLEEAIAIKELKRFAADHDTGLWKQNFRKAPATGKKVAVIGAGPAGLTAAYYLAVLGHEVTVFEALTVAGGMMRVGIPSYRLPVEVLESEIKEIEKLGVAIRTNSPVESLDELFGKGYQAVFVSVGAHRGTSMGIEGENSPGVIDGVDFLKEVNMGKKVRVDVGDRVLVVGGGNVAIDAARTALRLGAKEVNIVYRRTCLEMPASKEEIEEALEEGVKMLYLAMPTRVITVDGRLKVEFICMELGKVDASGRPEPVAIEGSQFAEEYSLMLKATGQESVVPNKYGLEMGRGGRIKVDPETLATARKGVYAGGDTVSGPASVIEAIAAGRQAAKSIDRYLGGEGNIDKVIKEKETPHCLGREEGFSERLRSNPRLLPLEARIHSFENVGLGLTTEQAISESQRCLRCDLRLGIGKPILPPRKKLWVEFTPENVGQVPETEGIFQLLDKQENIIYIKGAMNLRQSLREQIELYENARYFTYEEEPMYTKRESQLLQQYITEHGQMPEGNREPDDLF